MYSLFEKFFYDKTYANIRKILDYNNISEIEHLKLIIYEHSDIQLEVDLVNYLNFFEFIAALWQLRQMAFDEIRTMFEYYISRLGDYDFIMKYLEQEGFKGTPALVAKVRRLRGMK